MSRVVRIVSQSSTLRWLMLSMRSHAGRFAVSFRVGCSKNSLAIPSPRTISTSETNRKSTEWRSSTPGTVRTAVALVASRTCA